MTFRTIAILLAVCIFGFAVEGQGAPAPIAYDETADGDLADTIGPYDDLGIVAIGTNTVQGTIFDTDGGTPHDPVDSFQVTLPPGLRITSATYEISDLASTVPNPSGPVGWSIDYSRADWTLTYAPFGSTDTTGSFGSIYPATVPDQYTFTVGARFEASFTWAITLEVAAAPPLTVAIDIKPGSDPNGINPKAKGVIPVAVLGSDQFDPTMVDPGTVVFGPGGAVPSHELMHLEDVNGDGHADLIFHFETQETGIGCGDTSAVLTGETIYGQAISGSDSIKTVGC